MSGGRHLGKLETKGSDQHTDQEREDHMPCLSNSDKAHTHDNVHLCYQEPNYFCGTEIHPSISMPELPASRPQ